MPKRDGRGLVPIARRARDRDGTLITPPTLGSLHAKGDVTAEVFCAHCQHTVIIATDDMPAGWFFPDLPLHLRLVCSRCGGRDIDIRGDTIAFYARLDAEKGKVAKLPERYRVVRLNWRRAGP